MMLTFFHRSGTRPSTSKDEQINAPILAINSEAFTYWPSNFDLVKSLIEEAHPAPAWLMTVRGTIHVSQSDFSILYPNVCSLFLKATADPERALDINVNASLEFLKMVMPSIPEGIKEAFPNEKLLLNQTHTLDDIPAIQIHRPKDEKWIAARLRIPHEFTWRVAPGLARKMARKKVIEGGGSLDDEVWIHGKPDDETIDRYTAERIGKKGEQTSKNANAEPGSVPRNTGEENQSE